MPQKYQIFAIFQSKSINFAIQNTTYMTTEEQQRADEQFMRRALAEAEAAAEKGEIPIGRWWCAVDG